MAEAETIVNRKVPLSYMGSDPASDLRIMLEAEGFDPALTVGLLTAASLGQASVRYEDDDAYRLAVCTTAGTGNAARAGLPRTVFPSYRPGTINTVILIDGRMSVPAMVNAVITATEAKAAALQTLGIRDPDNGEVATGTTTDAVVVAVTQSFRWKVIHEYAGCAALIGNAIGRLVYESCLEAAGRQEYDD